MNPKIIKDESEIPEGAVRMHLYNPINVLMPRGSMKKESIGPYLLERLKNNYEDWTDEKYGDNPSVPDLINYLYTNLMGEVEQAWLGLVESILFELSERDQMIMKMSIMAAAKPEIESESVEWLLETMISKPSLFVTAICFIDQYDRRTPEFHYFTGLHTMKFIENETYNKMMNESQKPGSTLCKMFEEVDYFNDSKIIHE